MSAPRPRATAPGKAMLSGEYAVLFGAPAVCAAVARAGRRGRAEAWLDACAGRAATPLARAVARRALERAGAVATATAANARRLAARLVADTSALRAAPGGPKLGLGSSAAAAAALAAIALDALGVGAAPDDRLAVAIAAHRDACAPGGSGADVAAATLGGVVRVERTARRLRATATALPAGLDVRLYFTGAAASTAPRVARVLARAGEPDVAAALQALARAARAFARACDRGDAAALIRAARAQLAALAALERSAGVSILTAPHRTLAAIAEAEGGAGKPSGAGGGDVALAFAPDRRAGDRIAARAARAGLVLLELRLGVPGVAVAPARASRGRRPVTSPCR